MISAALRTFKSQSTEIKCPDDDFLLLSKILHSSFPISCNLKCRELHMSPTSAAITQEVLICVVIELKAARDTAGIWG